MEDSATNYHDNTPNLVLSELEAVEIKPTTPEEQGEQEDYDIQIQGSDRQYPAIVLRRKHRGVGATIKTISKFGQHRKIYADYEPAIVKYVVARKKRLDNTQNNREKPTTRGTDASGTDSLVEGWISQALQGSGDNT